MIDKGGCEKHKVVAAANFDKGFRGFFVKTGETGV